jgi:hypothetical protein
MRSMVEGAQVGTSRDDEGKHSVHVPEHVARWDPKNAESFTSKQRVASSIATRLVAERMSLPIHLDNHPMAETGEIRRDPIRRELAPELQPVRPLPQLLPQQDLGQAHLAPKLTRAPYLLDWCLEDTWAPSTIRLRRLVPLRVPGRIVEFRA